MNVREGCRTTQIQIARRSSSRIAASASGWAARVTGRQGAKWDQDPEPIDDRFDAPNGAPSYEDAAPTIRKRAMSWV